MNLLNKRSDSDSDDVLKGRFVRRALATTANDIDKQVRQKVSGFRSTFWNQRTFTVTDNVMYYEHMKQNRFLDMRTRERKDGSKRKKKNRIVHNRIVFGNYNRLVRELAYGFTEAVKNEIRQLND